MNVREAAQHVLNTWDDGLFDVSEALEILRAALAETESYPAPDAWRFRPWAGAKHWAYSEWNPYEFCNHDCEAEPLFL